MERIPSKPPQIAPLPLDVCRPLWSVMIPAYNCSIYLVEAIESVLMQDMGIDNMQIEVVDDCSTDADIEQLVKKVSGGRVTYYRQSKNVGSLRNFETCIKRSNGHYIHLLHGDDRVKQDFYESLTILFKQYPTAGAAFCAWDNIDSCGSLIKSTIIQSPDSCILEDCLRRLSVGQLLQVVSIAVKREVYEKLGCFYAVTYGEDWEMWARIAKYYPIAYIPKVLAEYRAHTDSISNNSFTTGQNIRDILKISSIINAYLPVNEQKKALKRVRKNYAYWACGVYYNLWLKNEEKNIVFKQVGEILKLSSNFKILILLVKLLLLVYFQFCIRILKKLFTRASYRLTGYRKYTR